MKIAVFAPDDLRVEFDGALAAHEVEFVDPTSDLLSELARFERSRFDAFVVMDGVLETDVEVITVLRAFLEDERRLDTDRMRVVFVSDCMRRCPSGFYSTLVRDLGFYDFVANGTGEVTYDYLSELVRVLARPPQRKDVMRFCVADMAQAAAQERAQGALEVGMRRPITSRICVAQASGREGSTHLSFAMARALALLGNRVALVLPERHLKALRLSYPKARFDDTFGRVFFNGFEVFAGENPYPPVEGYDYVICDLDQATWLHESDSPDYVKRGAQLKRTFFDAELRVYSSFISPTGYWGAGYYFVPKISRRELARTRLAVFGIHGPEMLSMLDDYVRSMNPQAHITPIPTILAPTHTPDVDSIDDSIYALLSSVLHHEKPKKVEQKQPLDSERQRPRDGLIAKIWRKKDG